MTDTAKVAQAAPSEGRVKPAAASGAAILSPSPHQGLPSEILWKIWAQIDNPRPLSMASKRFHELSKDTHWRAEWFMHHFDPYRVVFEAIARPKLCSAALVRQLRQLGAPLSVNVAQLLQAVFNARERIKHAGEDGRDLLWGSGIRFSAYAAVMDWAAFEFKNTIEFEPEDLQSLKFSDWMTNNDDYHRELEEDPEPDEQVRKLFSQGFMPLDVSFVRADEYDEESAVEVHSRPDDEVTQAIIHDPVLLDAAIENGYRLTAQRTEQIIDGWYKVFVNDKDHITPFAERLKVDGIIQVRKQYVRRTWFKMAKLRQEAPPGGYENYNLRVSLPLLKASQLLDNAEYTAILLSELDMGRALPFRIHEALGIPDPALAAAQAALPTSPKGNKRKLDDDGSSSDDGRKAEGELADVGKAAKKARLD